MKRLVIGILSALALFLAACAPTTVTPVEIVVDQPYDETFSIVSNTINTQPYPSDTSGWIITSSDQVGGFIAAEFRYTECGFLGIGGCEDKTAQVSVSLNERGENRTAVNISQTGDSYAQDLSERLEATLLRQ